jgi:hypothetical protein ORF022|nr:MAG TPA: nucelotide kinase [Caudoviricetes sp.]
MSDNEMKSPLAHQVGGEHYKSAYQPIEFITTFKLLMIEGNLVKYITRHYKKNGKEDLEKAYHYLTLGDTFNCYWLAPKNISRSFFIEELNRYAKDNNITELEYSVIYECLIGDRDYGMRVLRSLIDNYDEYYKR